MSANITNYFVFLSVFHYFCIKQCFMRRVFSDIFTILVLSVLLLFHSGKSKAQATDYTKLSSWVREIVMKENALKKSYSNKSTDDAGVTTQKRQSLRRGMSLCALVKTADGTEGVLAEYGAKAIDRIGDIIIADIPIDQISPLSADDRVLRIESRRSNKLEMDTSMLIVGSNHLYAGNALPQAYTGKGVVVGVQDVGFDLTHPTFYSRDLSQYRIKSFWDQLSTDTLNSEMYVGRNYESQTDILQYAHSRDAFLLSHGTHTAGSAAGSGYNTDYRGIAYDSDICLVSNAVVDDIELIDSCDLYKYTYATDLLGFKYIFDYADRVGQPCVISFSEGSHEDLRGDDALFYEALETLSGEGRIIVASAGNAGHVYSTVKKPIGTKTAGSYASTEGNNVFATIESSSDVTIRIIIHTDAVVRDTIEFRSEDIFLATDSVMRDSLTTWRGDFAVTIRGYKSSLDESTMVFDLSYTAPEPLGLYVPAWFETESETVETRMRMIKGYFYNYRRDNPTGEAFCGYTIHSPSSAPSVISVGATVHRKGYTTVHGEYHTTIDDAKGERAFYSSIGPTLDERIKPDVMAPGSNIISSYSSYYLEHNPDARDLTDDVSHFGFNGRVYAWNANSGTSMSTPIVAGIIALWLEAKPDLTRKEIIDALKATCSHPDESLTYPNIEYGYGLINAYAGLLYLLGLNVSLSADELSRHQPEGVSFILQNNRLTIETEESNFEGTLKIYTTAGKCVKAVAVNNNQKTIDLSLLSKNVYAVQLTTNKPQTTGSTLIRIK